MHGCSVVRVVDASLNDTEWVERYRGLPLPEALQLAESEGRPTRLLRPGDAVTLEWRPDRLNLHLDDAGELVEVYAG
jgi:hypothetical protein